MFTLFTLAFIAVYSGLPIRFFQVETDLRLQHLIRSLHSLTFRLRLCRTVPTGSIQFFSSDTNSFYTLNQNFGAPLDIAQMSLNRFGISPAISWLLLFDVLAFDAADLVNMDVALTLDGPGFGSAIPVSFTHLPATVPLPTSLVNFAFGLGILGTKIRSIRMARLESK